MMLLLSALVVVVLTAAAFALGFRAAPMLDAAAAIAEAEGRLAGFHADEVALADGGRGALLLGHDGRLALLLPFGDGWLARLLPAGRPLSRHDGQVIARLDEPMLRAPALAMAQLPGWAGAHLA